MYTRSSRLPFKWEGFIGFPLGLRLRLTVLLRQTAVLLTVSLEHAVERSCPAVGPARTALLGAVRGCTSFLFGSRECALQERGLLCSRRSSGAALSPWAPRRGTISWSLSCVSRPDSTSKCTRKCRRLDPSRSLLLAPSSSVPMTSAGSRGLMGPSLQSTHSAILMATVVPLALASRSRSRSR